MTPAVAAVIITAMLTGQLPELARTWAADRKDKRAKAAKETAK